VPRRNGGPGRLKGSRKKAVMSVTTPPASHKHGRPKGSRNQKTLVALTAAAAAAPTVADAIRAAPAFGGNGALRKRGPGRPKGEREGSSAGGSSRSFTASPPRTATG
jgi:hypothetical protein